MIGTKQLTIRQATGPEDATRQAREYLALSGESLDNVVEVVAPGFGEEGWRVTAQVSSPGTAWQAPAIRWGKLGEK